MKHGFIDWFLEYERSSNFKNALLNTVTVKIFFEPLIFSWLIIQAWMRWERRPPRILCFTPPTIYSPPIHQTTNCISIQVEEAPIMTRASLCCTERLGIARHDMKTWLWLDFASMVHSPPPKHCPPTQIRNALCWQVRMQGWRKACRAANRRDGGREIFPRREKRKCVRLCLLYWTLV